MSSPSASTSLVSPAVLAARAFVPKLDMFLASLANVGMGADQKTVVGAMRVFEKWLWHKGQAAEVTWCWEHELQEWCMAQYMENVGAAWLAPFEANFVGENVPGVKGKKTVLLAARDDCKARKG
ncbi:hypothetical protein C0992_001566, partial [Termitomyces sp. T32_za158]